MVPVSEGEEERRVAAIGEEYEDNAKAADAKYFDVHDVHGTSVE